MAVEVIDVLAPKNAGSFPTHDAAFGKGGYLSVASNTARDAIPAGRRSQGMRVRTNDTGLEWVLASNLTTWTLAVDTGRRDLIALPGTVIDLFVDPTGLDTNDGLSYATAFLTIQAAVDAIPENMYVTYDKVVRINVGAGTYDKFFVTQRGVFIRVIGDRRTPLKTWAALSTTFSLVSTYANRASANVGAWAGTIDETTHWIEGDTTSFGGTSDVVGAPILDSTSPNLHVPGDGTFGYSVGIHPYVTVIDCALTLPNGWVLDVDVSSLVELIGLSITSNQPVFFRRTYVYGCKTVMSVGSVTVRGSSGFSGVLDGSSNSQGGLFVEDSSFVRFVVVRRRAIIVRTGACTLYNCTVKGSFTNAAVEVETYIEVRDIDFETQRQGFSIRRNGILEMINVANGIKIQGAPTRILSLTDGALVKFPSTVARFTGVVGGVPIVITSGTILNAKACCSTFLTNSVTPASEITVGANASVLFSALPTTDLALGNTSTISRAT